MLTGIAHVNLTVPSSTLDEAEAFYSNTLGMKRVPVPALQRDRLAWFDITPNGQQVHIAFGPPNEESSRHPCFRVESQEALLKLQKRVYEHFEAGGKGAPRAADKPGEENSGSKGVEYPSRFFARDYAGNRLEFSL
ncbi:putative glyoxalase family protein [Aureobasidium melanogenum CBS 110374]|uniref:Putative glyoxalase family protein n=1 Tax=Aureobasidium melanogenum (strain CBS 110374) TaxID=1043003 RepID=A0A074VR63_AURM1|nr:putative glyoxalase family protein [Aureobasidium melanogenum CBS 110374]KEQ60157.1 putative glyoxalase family protein [Aureobasidium melanogenum CBS 110374]